MEKYELNDRERAHVTHLYERMKQAHAVIAEHTDRIKQAQAVVMDQTEYLQNLGNNLKGALQTIAIQQELLAPDGDPTGVKIDNFVMTYDPPVSPAGEAGKPQA